MCRPSATVRTARLTLADILHTHGPAYLASHRLAATQALALRAISACRTASLGGHLYRCDRCGFEQPRFNSCRNRHCPQCQTRQKEAWLAARRAELLPVGLLANRNRRKAREALGQFQPPPEPQLESVEAFMLRVAGVDIRLCPCCRQGRMHEVAILPPTRGPPVIGPPSTGAARLNT